MLRLEEIQVADVMTTPPLSFTLDTPLVEVARLLLEQRVNGAPVLGPDGGSVPLEVSVCDLLRELLATRAGQEAFEGLTLADIGLRPMLCRTADLSFPEACQQMVRAGVRRLVVGDGAHAEPLGIFSAVDALRAVACLADLRQRTDRARTAPRRVQDVMHRDVPCLAPDDPAREALVLMSASTCSHLPVVDRGALVGIVSRRDLLDLCARESQDGGERALDHPVWSLMTPRPLETASAGEPLLAAIRRLERFGALPVLEDGRLVGLLTRPDALRDYAANLGEGRLLPPGLQAEVSALVALC